MVKLTLDEKRLEALRHQLVGSVSTLDVRKTQKTGKSENLQIRYSEFADSLDHRVIPSRSEPFRSSEISYLRYDLLKILILSSVAIGIQVLLYFIF